MRLPQQVFCVETRRRVSRKGASVLTSSSYGTWGEGTAKSRKTPKSPKAPKITTRITAGAAGSSGSWARRSSGDVSFAHKKRNRFSIAKLVNYARDRRAKAGNSQLRRCRSVAKLSEFCNNVAATKLEIRIPKYTKVAELNSKHKAGNLQTSGYYTCVAGGRECGWTRRAALARPLPL